MAVDLVGDRDKSTLTQHKMSTFCPSKRLTGFKVLKEEKRENIRIYQPGAIWSLQI
jgi:hypothetical protein